MRILDWFKRKPKTDAERLKELEDAYEASRALGLPDAEYLAYEILVQKIKTGLKDKKK